MLESPNDPIWINVLKVLVRYIYTVGSRKIPTQWKTGKNSWEMEIMVIILKLLPTDANATGSPAKVPDVDGEDLGGGINLRISIRRISLILI